MELGGLGVYVHSNPIYVGRGVHIGTWDHWSHKTARSFILVCSTCEI